MSHLVFDHAGLAFNRQAPVLGGIDLSLRSGEFVVVIGRSGSGKTSLLNLAAGFLKASAGRILVDNVQISGPGRDRAVVFQDDALFPWLDARGNVAYPLALAGVPRELRLARADELLEQVGLTGAGGRQIWELSGGMRQRVGIARALAAEPKFLLMDEPLGALDALTRTKMQSFLLDVWQKSGTGVLLITHSIDEALFLATRIVVLAPSPGHIIADIDVDFGRRHLAGEEPRALRAGDDYKALSDRLVGLIHQQDEEIAA